MHSPYSLFIIVNNQKHHDFSATKERPSSTGQSPSGRVRVRFFVAHPFGEKVCSH